MYRFLNTCGLAYSLATSLQIHNIAAIHIFAHWSYACKIKMNFTVNSATSFKMPFLYNKTELLPL